SAADSDTSQDLGLISDTDLTKFYPGLENCRQVLHQLPEVNPSICSKIKKDLIIIKSILHINKFHFQVMFPDFFLTDLIGFSFLLPICLFFLVILSIGNADNIL